VEDAREVQVDDATPFLEWELVQWREKAGTRIVEEVRDPAETPGRISEGGRQHVVVGDVDCVGHSVDLGGDLLGRVTIYVEHGHSCAVGSEAPSRCSPDTGTTTRDHCATTFETRTQTGVHAGG
jgi:hypothetical protein